jgi:HK97 gp10 family phage protein
MPAPNKSGITIRVVSNRLPQASDAIHRAVVDQVKASTLDVQARAQAVVPVRTGTLRRSLHSVFEAGGLRGIVGTNLQYAPMVEFGTRHMSARPYLRPAAALVLPRFADALKSILKGLK